MHNSLAQRSINRFFHQYDDTKNKYKKPKELIKEILDEISKKVNLTCLDEAYTHKELPNVIFNIRNIINKVYIPDISQEGSRYLDRDIIINDERLRKNEQILADNKDLNKSAFIGGGRYLGATIKYPDKSKINNFTQQLIDTTINSIRRDSSLYDDKNKLDKLIFEKAFEEITRIRFSVIAGQLTQYQYQEIDQTCSRIAPDTLYALKRDRNLTRTREVYSEPSKEKLTR